MRYASDFRASARSALIGRWGIAVLAGLIAGALGALGGNTVSVNMDPNDSEGKAFWKILQQIFFDGREIPEEFIIGVLSGTLVILLTMLAVSIFIGSVVWVGYARFNLDLLDYRDDPKLKALFAYFPQWRTAVAASLLQGLYIWLWSLLFIIPGVIASLNYAMTAYILAEHPHLAATEAMEKSKSMMYGNRWRLFCLEFSFFGWNLLSAITLGIAELWVRPYRQAAVAAFYRDIAGRKSV